MTFAGHLRLHSLWLFMTECEETARDLLALVRHSAGAWGERAMSRQIRWRRGNPCLTAAPAGAPIDARNGPRTKGDAMSDQPDISLSRLQNMVQRVLDGQAMLREDNRALRRPLSRIDHRLSVMEHGVLALHGGAADQAERETAIQDQMNALQGRVERLERSRGS